MGWKAVIAVVHGVTIDDLSALRWTPTPGRHAWDESTEGLEGGVDAWQRDDVLVLAGGVDIVDRIDDLGALGPTYAGLFMSTTDSYAWEVAAPSGRRSWQWSEGTESTSEGTPHPAEAGIERLDEDTLFELLGAAGFVYDERLESAGLVVLDLGQDAADEAAPAPARRRRRFGLF
ncbi:hypothetical protein ABFT23_13130 [Nocardioides sp. C4-1]|uniref:hypothetical protein n=1 Tax=Nocardioides sp. C4-1 TaxID=3151851 RepID=UPI0032639507